MTEPIKARYDRDGFVAPITIIGPQLQGKSMIIEALHGAFVLGRSVGEAFFKAFYLDQACNVQLTVQQAGAAGAELMKFEQCEIGRPLASMASSDWYGYEGALEWAACLRCLDREAPEYKT